MFFSLSLSSSLMHPSVLSGLAIWLGDCVDRAPAVFGLVPPWLVAVRHTRGVHQRLREGADSLPRTVTQTAPHFWCHQCAQERGSSHSDSLTGRGMQAGFENVVAALNGGITSFSAQIIFFKEGFGPFKAMRVWRVQGPLQLWQGGGGRYCHDLLSSWSLPP